MKFLSPWPLRFGLSTKAAVATSTKSVLLRCRLPARKSLQGLIDAAGASPREALGGVAESRRTSPAWPPQVNRLRTPSPRQEHKNYAL